MINDFTLTGRRWRDEIETQLEPFTDRVRISYNQDTSFSELLSQVSSLSDQALILCGSYFLDRNSRYYPQAAVQSSLSEAASVPIFGLLDDSQTYGQLGGRYTNAALHGQIAANYLVEALRAGDTNLLTYTEPEEDNIWTFNWNLMQQYEIRPSQLPPGSVILNAPTSMRDSNPVLFYNIIISAAAGAVIIILLAIFALVLHRRNQKLESAQAEITAVKNHLQTILETALIAYSLLVDDIVVESNSFYRDNIGLIDGQKNADKYSPESRYGQLMQECREKGFVNIYTGPPV